MHATLDPIHNHYVEEGGWLVGWLVGESRESKLSARQETKEGRGCGCGRERAWFVFMASLMKIKVN